MGLLDHLINGLDRYRSCWWYVDQRRCIKGGRLKWTC